ncbi:MAG: hypothetical protein ACAI35_14270 [Candidatus Methylacidiphilales bacterium]
MRSTFIPLRRLSSVALATWLSAASLFATETENRGLRVVPAPGQVSVDGKIEDWDLTGGIFACGELEHLRDNSSVWLHAMHDSEYLYVLARWKDPTPLNNPESLGGHGFNGDCLQFRCILFPDTPDKCITWWDGWRDNQGRPVAGRECPGKRNGAGDSVDLPSMPNAIENGVKMAFHVDTDGKGYVQEMAIPWKLLSAKGTAPKTGERFKITFEPNFTAGQFGRITIKDVFDEVKAPDRIFTFRAYKDWGWATMMPYGKLEPQSVRTADGRSFPVSLDEGTPTVNWDGLVQRFEWPGFKPIAFDMPFDGYVSLNLVDKDGVVVRHLLNQQQRSKGPATVQWDGLTDATYRTPGQPVPAGEYTWKAIAHPGAKLTLCGYASFSGRAPWQATPEDFWLGDHGVPSSIVTDGDRLYLACNGAEGGRHLISTDFEGKLIWSLQNTSGANDPEYIAVDSGSVYVVHPKSTWRVDKVPILMTRVDAKTGAYMPWANAKKSHILTQTDLAGKDSADNANNIPDHIVGLDARDGLLYGTTGDTTFYPTDITDWKEFLTKVKADSSLEALVLDDLTPGDLDNIRNFLAGKKPDAIQQALITKIVKNLNEVLQSKTFAPGKEPETNPAKRALANRQLLEQKLAPSLVKLDHRLIVLDGNTGVLQKSWPLPLATSIKVVDAKTAYVICGDEVRSVDLTTGTSKAVLTGLANPRSLNVDAKGRLLVSLGAPEHQVAVFSMDGKEIGRIGEKDGRQTGPWQANRMLKPAGIVVDARGKLWVMEHDEFPKRVSVWAYGNGSDLAPAAFSTTLLKQFFGPTHYGASGGAVNPRDPDIMVGEACEWRIDPKGGPAECLGTFDNNFHGFAAYREGSNGKLYLYTVEMRYGVGSIQIWERLGDGQYKLHALLRNDPKNADPKTGATELWTDLNGDGKEQPEEVQRHPGALYTAGSNCWSLNLGPDLSLYAFDKSDGKLKALTSAGFTDKGAPKYDLTQIKTMPDSMSNGYRNNYSCALPSVDNKHILLNLAVKDHPAGFMWHCFDMASGKLMWTYPNPYFQVHGSHKAPQPENGLFRGAFGPVGTGNLPGVGCFWAINGNLGEWWALNSEGFFVSGLYSGNIFDWQWPEKPLPGSDMTNLPAGCGGEDFGGSLTQAKDGKVYIQSGKIGIWNVALSGLEKTVPIAPPTGSSAGKIVISEPDTKKALAMRETALQTSAGGSLTVTKATIKFTGNLDQDFKGCNILSYQKSEDAAVRTALACDDTKLYVGWHVRDMTPWINGAKDISQMYSCGDTVDLQLATSPDGAAKRGKAMATKGDLRLSIGNYNGKPTAVLYRFISDEKKPRTFSSGVIQGWVVDYVDVLADAEINVKVDAGKGYIVEAALPLDSLGIKLTPKLTLRGDFGATHADPAGVRTRLRTHWSNQHTGLVDDVVFELQPEPANWGELNFP